MRRSNPAVKTAIIIRHEERSRELADLLRAEGYHVVFMPLIAIVPPSDDYASLDAALCRIAEFDWVVLTSANGVRSLFDRAKTLHIPSDALAGPRTSDGNGAKSNGANGEVTFCSVTGKGPRIAAVGPMTAEAIRSRGGRVDLVPEEHSAKGLGKAFSVLDVRDLKFLLPQARGGRRELIDFLTMHGAGVETVEAYQAVPSKENFTLPASFDEIYFFSPSAVREFVRRFGAAILGTKTLHPIGETTAAEIEKFIPHQA